MITSACSTTTTSFALITFNSALTLDTPPFCGGGVDRRASESGMEMDDPRLGRRIKGIKWHRRNFLQVWEKTGVGETAGGWVLDVFQMWSNSKENAKRTSS